MTFEPDSVHQIPATNALRRSLSRWRLVAFLALAVAILAIGGRFALEANRAEKDHIARVVVEGVISTDAERLATFKALAEDETVKAVIVAINSPGGTTAGGEELYEALNLVRSKKPVVAVIRELGASAAYMTAIGADRIYARRLSIVGSIGVLFQHVDASKLLDTIGIDFDKVQTGPLKAEPDINDAMVGEVRASLQTLVDDSYQWFVDVVAERRQLARTTVLTLADGRIVTGRMGVDLGLIDDIGGEDQAVDWLESEKDLASELPIWTHYPLPQGEFDKWLNLVGGKALSGALDAAGLGQAGTNTLDGLVSLWQAARVEG